MKIRKHNGLTFDDVLLLPKRSPVRSRNDVNTSTLLTSSINMHIPVASANMDTVTEAKMAIAMAQAGGIGMIHRFMTTEQQVKEVRKVKRARGFIVERPRSIAPETTVAEAVKAMEHHGVGGLVVLDEWQRLVGLVTKRDVMLAPADLTHVHQVMTPTERLITASPDISSAEAQKILYKHRLEKLPLIDDQNELVGLITGQDLIKSRKNPHATVDDKGRLRVGAAIGVSEIEMTRVEALLAAGADVLVLDIAHGHADHCIDMVTTIRQAFPVAQIIAGNIATREGAKELAEAGASAIKVGIGPGSICTTRIVTGFGVPQLTAIIDSAEGIAEAGKNIPIIADGGIKTSGDMVKALAAGADSVMIGSLFAGSEESPGSPVIRNGQKFKVVRGMASLGAAIGRKEAERVGDESAESAEDWDKVIPEGVEAVVPYRGHVHEILHQLVGGLRSGLSYGGARTIAELQENAEFIKITAAGVRESHSHDVKRI